MPLSPPHPLAVGCFTRSEHSRRVLKLSLEQPELGQHPLSHQDHCVEVSLFWPPSSAEVCACLRVRVCVCVARLREALKGSPGMQNTKSTIEMGFPREKKNLNSDYERKTFDVNGCSGRGKWAFFCGFVFLLI